MDAGSSFTAKEDYGHLYPPGCKLEMDDKELPHSDSEISYNSRFASGQHDKHFMYSNKQRHRNTASSSATFCAYKMPHKIFERLQMAIVKKSKQTTVSFILGVVVGISLTAMLFQHNFLMKGTQSQRNINLPDGFVQHTSSPELDPGLDTGIHVHPRLEGKERHRRVLNTPEELNSLKRPTPKHDTNKNEIRRGSKVFVGVITAEKFLSTRAIAVNSTWGSQVDKISFFTEKGSSEEYGIPVVNLEGVSDKEYPPQKKAFNMLKYMCKNLIDKYDWFIRADDDVYIRVEKLKLFLGQIDSDKLIYLGQPGHGVPEVRDRLGLNGHNFCMGGPSVIFNRKAMLGLCPHLDECMAEVVSGEEDVEIGRCVSKHLHIECTHAWETLKLFYHSYQEEYTEERPFLGNLAENVHVEKAITLHHVKLPYIMYKIHRHFMRLLLNTSNQAISYLREQARSLNSHLPFGKHREFLEGRIPQVYKAEKQSDVAVWNSFSVESLFTLSYVNPSDDITNDCLADLKQIGETAIDVAMDHCALHLSYSHVAGGYYRSDPLRGTDYLWDIFFTSKEGGKPNEMKRVHILRPLAEPKPSSIGTYDQSDGLVSVYVILALEQSSGGASDLEDYMTKYYQQVALMNSMAQGSEIRTTLLISVYGGKNDLSRETRDTASPTIQDVVSWFRVKYPQSIIDTIPRLTNNGKDGTVDDYALFYNAAQAYTKGTLHAIKQWNANGKGVILLSSTNFTLSRSLLEACARRSSFKGAQLDIDGVSTPEASFFYQPVSFTLYSSRDLSETDYTPTEDMGYWNHVNENRRGDLNLPLCGSMDDFISVTNYMQSDPNQNVIKMIYENIYDSKFFLQRVPDKHILTRRRR